MIPLGGVIRNLSGTGTSLRALSALIRTDSEYIYLGGRSFLNRNFAVYDKSGDLKQSLEIIESKSISVEGDSYIEITTNNTGFAANLMVGTVIESGTYWVNSNDISKLIHAQCELKDFATSPIKTTSSPVTRLPETLTVLTDTNFTIEAGEGIQVNGNEISGFGYIRKLEVK